jgi:hypothetical protein
MKAAELQSCARYFESTIRTANARIGFVVEYYGLQGMAFVLACRRAGIPVVDLQHGLQGTVHFAYAQWHDIPLTGHPLLPDVFWVWSEAEAAVIRAWAPPSGAHRALVGGNPWLEDFDRGHRDESAADPGTPARRVLYTLHGMETDAELDLIGSYLSGSPAEWTWWVRPHPTVPGGGARLRGSDRRATAPLPDLLREADVHVTSHSSVVLEAEALGVPSVITSTVGQEVFADQISRAVAVGVDGSSAAAVVAGIDAAVRLHVPRPLGGVRTDHALRELLVLADLAGAA